MDAFFFDPDVVRLPPESVRLTDLRATPLADGRRVHIWLELTPFEKRPEIELNLTAPGGEACGLASIVEPVAWKLELTMHIRSVGSPLVRETAGRYELIAILLYPEIGEVDRRSTKFMIPATMD